MLQLSRLILATISIHRSLLLKTPITSIFSPRFQVCLKSAAFSRNTQLPLAATKCPHRDVVSDARSSRTPQSSSSTTSTRIWTRCCVALSSVASVAGLRMLGFLKPKAATKAPDASGAANSDVAHLLADARQHLAADRPHEARQSLHEALRQCESIADYTQLAEIYDLLVTISIQAGRIAEAEEMLVRFIEKLLQLGVADTDNQIVRYRLKLSRLYQVVGNTQMAEIGYRSCVNMQEDKLRTDKEAAKDPYTHLLYLSSLFWYGRFLTEGSDLLKAQSCMQRALEHERMHTVLEPAQLMVFLFHTAEISFRLQQYDDSLLYLTQALDVCMNRDPENVELPVFLVKMGVVFYHMQLYEEARYWCEKGRHFARMHRNRAAEEEADQFLRKMLPKVAGDGEAADCGSENVADGGKLRD